LNHNSNWISAAVSHRLLAYFPFKKKTGPDALLEVNQYRARPLSSELSLRYLLGKKPHMAYAGCMDGIE
jgi:hypothetical protein